MSPNDSVDDPYAVLGVTGAASPDELRRAFRQRMRSVHPDTKNGDEEAAKQVNAAYTLLSDPARRRIYDRTRSAQAAERSGVPAMCFVCGIDLSLVDSVEDHLQQHQRERRHHCQICGRWPTTEVAFESNVGFLLRRVRYSFAGRVCKHCATGVFREFQARNVAFGWWSLIGWFATWFYLVGNLIQYRRLRALKTPEPSNPVIERTLKGRPVLLRPTVVIVWVIVTGFIIVSNIADSDANSPRSEVGGSERSTPQTVLGWNTSSCVTMSADGWRAEPVLCSSNQADGQILTIVGDVAECPESAGPWIEIDAGEFACIGMWLDGGTRTGAQPSISSEWLADDCVAIHPDRQHAVLVPCSAELAVGTIVAMVPDASDCAFPADHVIKVADNRIACIDEWDYRAHEWRVGACVSTVDGLSELVDCTSERATSKVLAIIDDTLECPENSELVFLFNEERIKTERGPRTVCLSGIE